MEVLKYLVGMQDFQLVCDKGVQDSEVVGFCDSDLAGDSNTKKSTSVGAFLAGSAAVSWISKLQQRAALALSMAESQFFVMCLGVQKALWLDQLAADFLTKLMLLC